MFLPEIQFQSILFYWCMDNFSKLHLYGNADPYVARSDFFFIWFEKKIFLQVSGEFWESFKSVLSTSIINYQKYTDIINPQKYIVIDILHVGVINHYG